MKRPNRHIPDFEPWVRARRGSALILTMLILLVLTAIGMVALKDVARTVHQSGVYRVRSQSETFTSATSEFISKRAGDNAAGYWNRMEDVFDEEKRNATSVAEKDKINARGALMSFEQDSASTGQFDVLGTSTTETGLFTNNSSSNPSFEQQASLNEFRIVLRDPIDAIPAPGYDDNFCFKKVTIATQANIGQPDPEWNKSSMVSRAQSGSEVLLGPMDCASN